jgi:hypothetical protein
MYSFITFYLGLNSYSWLFCDSAIHYQSNFPFTPFSLSTKAKYLIQPKSFVYILYTLRFPVFWNVKRRHRCPTFRDVVSKRQAHRDGKPRRRTETLTTPLQRTGFSFGYTKCKTRFLTLVNFPFYF